MPELALALALAFKIKLANAKAKANANYDTEGETVSNIVHMVIMIFNYVNFSIYGIAVISL